VESAVTHRIGGVRYAMERASLTGRNGVWPMLLPVMPSHEKCQFDTEKCQFDTEKCCSLPSQLSEPFSSPSDSAAAAAEQVTCQPSLEEPIAN
jgi:hypothetical protein